jgi:hypothetical protein
VTRPIGPGEKERGQEIRRKHVDANDSTQKFDTAGVVTPECWLVTVNKSLIRWHKFQILILITDVIDGLLSALHFPRRRHIDMRPLSKGISPLTLFPAGMRTLSKINVCGHTPHIRFWNTHVFQPEIGSVFPHIMSDGPDLSMGDAKSAFPTVERDHELSLNEGALDRLK